MGLAGAESEFNLRDRDSSPLGPGKGYRLTVLVARPHIAHILV